MLIRETQRLADSSGTGTEQANIVEPAPRAHDIQPGNRLKRANENPGAMPVRSANEIEAPVDSIGAVDISVERRPEHDEVSPGRATKAVGGWIFMIIRLDLDDSPADPVDQESRSYQGLRHFERSSIKVDI